MRRKGSTSSSGGAGSGGLNDAEASLLDRNSKLKALVGFVMLSAGLLFSERFAHPQAPLPAAAPPQGQTAATPSASTSAALFAALPAALPAASETPAPVVGSLRAAGLSSPPQFGADVETVTLRSGIQMPAVGYGTCCRSTAKGKAVVESTIKYLKAGGKLIDTAMAYRNHKDIGKALRASGVAREAIWLTSKIAPSAVRSRTDTVAACHDILKDLGVEYLDLLLIHSPKLGRAKTTDLWKGLIDLQKDGKVRAIGVSNMNWGEINDLETATGVAPEVNQIQFHPWTPKPWRDLASRLQREKGIAVTACKCLHHCVCFFALCANLNSCASHRVCRHVPGWTTLSRRRQPLGQGTRWHCVKAWSHRSPGPPAMGSSAKCGRDSRLSVGTPHSREPLAGCSRGSCSPIRLDA